MSLRTAVIVFVMFWTVGTLIASRCVRVVFDLTERERCDAVCAKDPVPRQDVFACNCFRAPGMRP